jgi:transcriptional regulator with XRE-family HTH domain
MDKKSLAEESGVHRNTLSAIEEGESFNRTSLARIERALERLELEAGIDAPAKESPGEVGAGETFEFSITEQGITVAGKGPVRDAEELKRQVLDLIRQARESRESE